MSARQERILLADDEETFREATADLLREQGYDCTTAIDALDAAEILKKGSFDLLIADIRMAGNVELELIENIARIDPELQVIIITGYPSIQTAIQSIQLPVIGYLIKPVDFGELLDLINRGLQIHRVMDVLHKMQHRQEQWAQDMNEILQARSLSPKVSTALTPNRILQLSQQNITADVLDFRALNDLLDTGAGTEAICKALGCPVRYKYRSAIFETIAVLEKTKGAFKSKELERLRKNLESLVREEDQ